MDAGAVKLEERKRQFMTAVDFSDQRQRREMFAVELRRQKRNENAQKRRLLSSNTYSIQSAEDQGPLTLEEIPVELQSQYTQLRDPRLTDLDRAGVLKTVLSTPHLEPRLYLQALTLLRKSLSKDTNPPIRAVLRLGLIPVFLTFTNPALYPPEIIYEATWAICNIVSGPHDAADSVVMSGGIPLLLNVIDPSVPGISEHAIWALGNIAGDCEPFRDLVLNSRGHEAVTAYVLKCEHIETVHARTIAWTITTFLRGKTRVPLNICEELLKAIGQLAKIDDLEVQKDVLWALSSISDGENDYTQLVINACLGKHAARFITSPEPVLVNPAVRILGNIASGDDLMTQYALDLKLLDKLAGVVVFEDSTIRKEVMWTLSNVTAGTKDQIQAFLNHKLCDSALHAIEDPELAVRKEVSWIFFNIAKRGKQEQKLHLADIGIFNYFKTALSGDSDIILRTLETTRELLSAGADFRLQQNLAINPCAQKLEETDCLTTIEHLQSHPNPEVASCSLRLIADFFGFEETGNVKDAAELEGGFRF